MPFQFSFRVDPGAITVPYAAITDDIRRNRGFVDLRGHPDKANEIVEGNDSPALRHLLVRLANVGSAILTLGCDLGAHQEPPHVPLRRREVGVNTFNSQAFATITPNVSPMQLSQMQLWRM